MNREEAIEMWVIPALKNTWNEKRCNEVLEALEQEPCEDEYIKIPKKALKYRTAGMVAYNAEWLKNHFDIERAVICGAQEPCDDAISRQDLREPRFIIAENDYQKGWNDALDSVYENAPSVTPAEKVSRSEDPNKWIPVKWHEITDEEREREGYPKEWACHLDSIMPYDGQRILITTKGGYVELDECYSDDGCTFSLDSGYDWVDDVVAWCELPEPYKASPTGAEGSEE